MAMKLHVFILACVLVLIQVSNTSACCANGCSGHGSCQNGCTCSCYNQWTGSDCSLRQCPSGLQWVGDGSATDTVHSTNAVCSNAGKCNDGSGLCTCQSGFEGLACERLACPKNCNNHGQCVTLKDAASTKDDWNFFRQVTYSTEWDATRIMGCKCDYGWHGHDCSLRKCPGGDDPMTTGQVDEIQAIDCTCSATCSGNFYLSFRGLMTKAIPHDASASVVKARLEELDSIHTVSVSLTGGSTACDTDGVSIVVTFTHNSGDVPTIQVAQNDLSTTGATKTLTVYHDGQTSGQSVVTVVGTKEDYECNGRGKCDSGTGLCTCYTNFASSNKLGATGTSGDCGYESGSAAACPGTTSCSGHGTCSGASTYVCTCDEGFTGADCNTRVCPKGKAWFSEAGESLPGYVSVANAATTVTTTSDLRNYINRGDTVVINGVTLTVSTSTGDTFDGTNLPLASAYTGATVAYAEAYARPENAHNVVECSGRGKCDTTMGTCTCDEGFSGSACDRVKCPSDCSGRGSCLTLAKLVEETTSNGDATAYTYGQDATVAGTWDHDMMMGCKCDKQLMTDVDNGMYDFYGHDCSLISCMTGDDPSTTSVKEVQTITCDATGGTFTVTFRQKTTAAIAVAATAATVKSTLEALSTIGTVSVSFSTGVAACASGGIGIAVSFTTEMGDLPAMTTTTSLTGGAGTAVVAETTKGTAENAECSNHGLCDRNSGYCKCFSGYVSSDSSGNAGPRGDCGARDALYVAS